jgi:hypothetical protein
MNANGEPALPRNDMMKIGHGLRDYYDQFTGAPLPARMEFLLRQIEAVERQQERAR